MPKLINSVLSTLPSEWDRQNYDMEFVELCRYELEYQELKAKMSAYPLTRIVRIENPFLWGFYQLKKEECLKRWSGTKEMEMWHVTDPSCVQSIASNNCDWRLSNRARYGRGVCFSPDLDHALRYSTNRGAVILAKVLVGRTCPGNCYTDVPPVPNDTTTGWGDNVYVKFMDHEFYPAYVAYLL